MHSYQGADGLFDLREKVRRGEEVTTDEYALVVQSLREGRASASKEGTKAKSAASKAPPPDLDAIFGVGKSKDQTDDGDDKTN